MRKEVPFEIIEEVAVLSEAESGWTKEINIVSWNGEKPKFDIRSWSPDGLRHSHGTNLTENEALALADAIASYFGREIVYSN